MYSDGVMCYVLPGPDVEQTTSVLLDVKDWKGLANWLNVRSNDIERNCVLDGTQASCYRRTVVCRYYNSKGTDKWSEIAESIAEVLETKMDHKRQAQQLRSLVFGKLVVK